MAVVLHVQGLKARPDTLGGMGLHVDGLRLEAGGRLGIEGPAGSGKSSLLDLLAMLSKPASVYRMELLQHEIGQMLRDGQDTLCNELRAIHIGLVPSRGGVMHGLSVRDNLRLSQRLLGLQDEAWIDRVLKALELTADARRRLGDAPRALQQRVSVGRALAHRPALVLADDLLDGGEPESTHKLVDVLLKLTAALGAGLVITGRELQPLRQRGVPVRRLARGADGHSLEAA